jgi:hypothetical protein
MQSASAAAGQQGGKGGSKVKLAAGARACTWDDPELHADACMVMTVSDVQLLEQVGALLNLAAAEA